MPDHVHMLLRYRPDAALSDLIRDIKSNSSKWIHEEFRRPDFACQEGYSAFSVSKSGEKKVAVYIQNQEKHHKTMDSKSELLKLLEKHGIEVDMSYFQ